MTTRIQTRGGPRIGRWVLGGFLIAAAFFLWTEHRAHLYGALPFVLVAACLLMHLFHRHGDGGDRDGSRDRREPDPHGGHR